MSEITIADLQTRLFVTVPETARLLRADERTIRSGIRAGQIPATRIGNAHRVPAAWLCARAQLIDDAAEAAASAQSTLSPGDLVQGSS